MKFCRQVFLECNFSEFDGQGMYNFDAQQEAWLGGGA
jgi:hypothetical protein